MKKSVEKTETEIDLVARGKEYLELESASRWIDKEYFDSDSGFTIPRDLWWGSQNNLRKLKGIAKEFEEVKTDISKAWKKSIEFDEALYEKGANKDSENKEARQYVAEVDVAYRLHMKSDEVKKDFDAFYEGIKEIEFYKVSAEIIDKAEVPFDIMYLAEKYYQK